MNKKGNIIFLILIIFFSFSLLFSSYYFFSNRNSHLVQENLELLLNEIDKKEIAYQVYLENINYSNAYKEGDKVFLYDGDNIFIYEFYVDEKMLKVKKKNE